MSPTRLVRRPLAGALALVCAALPAWAAAPAGVDYEPIDGPWNGVGYLITTGAEARVEVELVDALALGDLSPDDVLLWLYPQAPVPADDLLAFVGDGGRLIIADDHGGADELLAAAGIARRGSGPTAHRRWFEGADGFPILTARGGADAHFLFFNVDEIVANHPSVLTGEGRAIVSFDRPDGPGAEQLDEHLVVERAIGRGALLAIADPSLFLNQMLRRFYGNKQFAANVLRLYCRAEPCRIKLLLPTTRAAGNYASEAGHLGPLPRLVERGATALNEALASLSDLLATPLWTVALALLTALLAGLLLALGLATWRARPTSPVLEPGVPAHSPVVVEARGLSAGRGDADFGELARTLVDRADRLLATRRLAGWIDGHDPPPPGESEASLHAARGAALRVRQDTASLRSRLPAAISSERFVRLFDDVQILARFGGTRRGGRRAATDA